MGSSGILVPNVDTQADAEKLVSCARFAPEGVRGFGNTTRAGAYGTIPIKEFMRRGNEETLISAHCETSTGVKNLQDIVKVPGIDVIFIGPGDLSQAYGCTGEAQTTELKEAIDFIIQTSLKAGKSVGVACQAAQIKDYFVKGVRFFSVGTDHSYALVGAKNVKEAFITSTV
jgi:4-hydroxy-2-oxoheptanedioate aldolase